MNKFRFTINALAVLVFTLAFASLAQAQASRTWVSGVGDDANPCSRTAPCKTFAGAISKTANFGEIDALDPGGFGALTITKSITIDGGGGQVASVLTAGTPGIQISATATDVITLNNLRFQGLRGTGSPGTNAIRITNALAVHVMNCIIENWGNNGIDDVRTNLSFLEVNNTSITNCNNGISVVPASGSNAINVHVGLRTSRPEFSRRTREREPVTWRLISAWFRPTSPASRQTRQIRLSEFRIPPRYTTSA